MTTEEGNQVLQDRQAIQFFKEHIDKMNKYRFVCAGIDCYDCPLITFRQCATFPPGFYEKLLDLISQKPLRLNIKKL